MGSFACHFEEVSSKRLSSVNHREAPLFSEKSYLFDSPISSATGRPSRFHLVELLVEGQLTHGEEFRVTWWDELQDVGPVGKCNLNMT